MAKAMPIAAGFLLAGAMASLGLPGMSGFVSEFMAFLGLFKEHAEYLPRSERWHYHDRCVFAREGLEIRMEKQNGIGPELAICNV